MHYDISFLIYLVSAEKPPFLEFEPASAVKFDPDLTGGFRVKCRCPDLVR